MKRTLLVRPQAEMDIIRHRVYLLECQPAAEKKFSVAVRKAVERIATHPRTAATLALSSLPNVELRFCKPRGFRNYLIVYQVLDDQVVVLRVLHASQDIETALKH